MLPANPLKTHFVCMLLCSMPIAFAQAMQPPDTADRPTQRWLPFPQGDGIELSEQAQLLQQLRDLISSEPKTEAGNSQLPKLSERQLQEMEKTLETLRDQFGTEKLPNLENIPKEWIDQALSDPILRNQAQQLLEQYARDRKFPAPPERTPQNSEGVPFPNRQPSSQAPKQNAKSQPKSTSSPKSNATSKSKSPTESSPNRGAQNDLITNDPNSQGRVSGDPSPNDSRNEQTLAPDELRGESSGDVESSQVPGQVPSHTPEHSSTSRPDAERIQALQELFKRLKTIEGKRQPAKNSARNSAADLNSRSANPRNSNSSSTHQAENPNTPGSQPKPGSPRSPRNNSPKQTPSLPKRIANDTLPTQPAAEFSNADSSNDPTLIPDPFSSELESSNSVGLEGSAPPQSNFPKPPFDSSSRGNAAGTPTLGSGPNGNGRNPLSRKPNNWPSPNERNPSPAASDGSLRPEVDIKTQLERHGLGRALQSIVEKTLQEQGESSSAKESSASRSSKPNSKLKDKQSTNNALTSTTPAAPPSRKSAPPSSHGSGQINGSATTANAPVASNPNPNASSTMSGLRDMAAQIWGAIRSTPEESRSGLSASNAEAMGSGLGEFAFTWSGRVWLLLLLVFIGVVVLFLLARKRIELATAREAEAELAKEILTEGIRTRADVVRAFHRFVLRRTQPVATWWNHRYVASRLTESSPQLRSVISDLVRVYEHARYLPPEVALSSAEIDCVQAALKQCATGGV